MKTLCRILAMSMLALLVLSVGCAKRDNPVVPDAPLQGQIAWFTHDYDGMKGATWETQGRSRWVAVYCPPGYNFELIGDRYPALFLLPGFDGEPTFYFQHGNETYYMAASVGKVADRLIADGIIKPMFIVMPDASIPYGGAFFANSTLAGRWEDMMSVELVHKIDTLTQIPTRPGAGFRTLARRDSRGISGHSSGGYGAFRVAMKHDSLFNSVSAIDAPLAFSGSGSFGGIKDLFQDYLDESSITTEVQFAAADTLRFAPQPFKKLFYSMAATYSPAAKTAAEGLGSLRIALPFDYQGNVVPSVWDSTWLPNDLFRWLPNYQNTLKSQNIYLESSDHDVNLFNRQTQVFEQELTKLGIPHTAATFTKYPGYDARSRSFLYDRLEKILIFHDKYLKDRDNKY